MPKTNKLIRILSVFLTVVIVTIGFLQPIAYANTAVVGLAELLIAAMLTAAGMTFATPQQAQSTASQAINAMPSSLYSKIVDASLNVGMIAAVKSYQLFEKGLPQFVSMANETWIEFKTWVNTTYGINVETVAQGNIFNMQGVRMSGIYSGVKIPEYLPVGYAQYVAQYPYIVINYDDARGYFVFFCYQTKPKFNGSNVTGGGGLIGSCTTSKGNPTWSELRVNSSNLVWSITSTYWPIYANFDVLTSSGSMYFAASDSIVNPIINVSADAYNHAMPSGVGNVEIAMPSTIDGVTANGWNDVLSNYDGLDRTQAPTADWDFQKSLERMREAMESICVDLAHTAEYDALLNQAQAMEMELTKVWELVAEQGVDVVGGVGELNDAMLDAGWVITSLTALLNALEQDATKIGGLESELSAVKDKLHDLTKSKETDIPENPPTTDEKEGKINWSILLGIAIFDKFPFCLPKDVHLFFQTLAAPPKEPVFVFDLFNGKFGKDAVITLDFTEFDDIRLLVRNGIFIALIAGLIISTKVYIWK